MILFRKKWRRDYILPSFERKEALYESGIFLTEHAVWPRLCDWVSSPAIQLKFITNLKITEFYKNKTTI